MRLRPQMLSLLYLVLDLLVMDSLSGPLLAFRASISGLIYAIAKEEWTANDI